MKPNIAIIEPVGGHGGMNYYDFGLATGLVNANFNIFVYTSIETPTLTQLPFEIIKSFKGIWGEGPKLLRALRFFFCLLATLKNAKKKSICLVHYHFFHYTILELYSVKLAKFFKFKIVITAHDIESFAGQENVYIASTIFDSADIIIVHNKISQQELLSKKRVVDHNKVKIIPHGNYLNFITDNFCKIYSMNKLGISVNEKIILFFGQIKEVKGLDILICALPEVIKKYTNVKLLISGKMWKDDFSRYEKLIIDNSVQNNVISHIRYISEEEVAYYYYASDLVVLPYRKIYQSGVLLMAMSYKKPVLVSDIPGMTEIIIDGQNGYTFESENVEHLKTKLLEIFSYSPEVLSNIAEAGYSTVATDHDWNKIGSMTSEAYKTILL